MTSGPLLAAASTHCTPTMALFSKKNLVFGKGQTRKAFYLIKNKTKGVIWIDFSDAHIGATAWIGSSIKAKQWLGYIYLPGTSYLPAINQKKKVTVQRIRWQCYSKDYKQVSCQNVLLACKPTANQEKDRKKMKRVLALAKRSWWVTSARSVNSGSDLSPFYLTKQSYSLSPPIYGHCKNCRSLGALLEWKPPPHLELI